MAKKKMGGLGKGLDSLFADLSDDTGSEASNSKYSHHTAAAAGNRA